MKESSQKFLEFNGNSIFFIAKDGQYWIAIKPICEALNVDYIQQFKNLKEDEILSELLCKHTIVAADGALRKMMCLPEKWVYGWLFSIRSESKGLKEFKKECYHVLYNHFHGGIRSQLLSQQVRKELELENVKQNFMDELAENEKYKKVLELEEEVKILKKQVAQKEKEERMGMRDMFESQG